MTEIKLVLEGELLERLDSLVPLVSESAAAREFGIVVDRHLVARVALLRGLSVMESASPPPAASVVDDDVVSVAPPPPLLSSPPPPPPPAPLTASDDVAPTAEVASEVSVSGAVDVDADGFVSLPAGWHRWSTAERVPGEHADIHSYYIESGWSRYWGHAGDEVISFYWSPDPSLHDLPSYKKPDTNGKVIKVQETPYGPGHIIPHGWAG
jgi:hypothetical protein